MVTRLVRRLALSTVLALAAGAVSQASGSEAVSSTFDSDGMKIHYRVQGVGEPLLLIHGLAGSAEADWTYNGMLDRLAAEFRVIAPDARGHGNSDKPHDPDAYGLEMVEDLVRLLDHLEIPRAHVVGYSMGGFLALKLIEQAPERILSAVVGGAGWSRGDDWELMSTLADSLERGDGIAPLFASMGPAGQPPPSPEQVQMMNQMVMSQNDPLALAATARSMRELTVTEEALRANRVPTLAIVGSLDQLKVGVDALEGVMSALEVELIEGADHMTAVMNPEYVQELTEQIRRFVTACECG